mmetsp:Transcript_13444/g.36874  ORF Transcript_13444/g.36874 Transcript_13444/m.36874 type:complete len:272 (-) Transcript_13444:125-940(-)
MKPPASEPPPPRCARRRCTKEAKTLEPPAPAPAAGRNVGRSTAGETQANADNRSDEGSGLPRPAPRRVAPAPPICATSGTATLEADDAVTAATSAVFDGDGAVAPAPAATECTGAGSAVGCEPGFAALPAAVTALAMSAATRGDEVSTANGAEEGDAAPPAKGGIDAGAAPASIRRRLPAPRRPRESTSKPRSTQSGQNQAPRGMAARPTQPRWKAALHVPCMPSQRSSADSSPTSLQRSQTWMSSNSSSSTPSWSRFCTRVKDNRRPPDA